MHRPEAEFWALTPREVHAAFELHNKIQTAEQRAENIRFGSVMATILNAAPFRGKSRKVWKWTDFFKDVEPTKPISSKAARAIMLSHGSAMKAFEDRRAKSKANPSRTDEAQQGS